MKAKDLRARATEDLLELQRSVKKELFGNRMKNFTNQLDDTSQIQKARRDLARIEGILKERANEAAPAGGSAS
ncbi:MAG TPA: 50S ribosomal protein L29 [Polyangiaceae bacterium]|jgi:large subunit ribosomal protein L29|nr:50S ribosomal protein L29 [Polyangiaceae bacterium]